MSELEDPDTMLDLPFAGAHYVLLTVSNLQYDDRSLDRVVTGEYETGDFARADLETSIDGLVHFDQVFVLFGDVDAEEIDAELTDPETRFETTFERVDELDSFDLYQPAESSSDDEMTQFVSSLTYDGPTSASTEFAIDYDRDIPEEERIGLESDLGADAEAASVDVDGDRVSATASWDDLDAVLETDE